MPDATPPAAPDVRRPFVVAAVMASTFMIAIEATIVSTAMPQIAGQLGDLHLYSWVFSAFLLTQTATTVVFGKMADLFGRRPVLLVGIAIFLVGSLLCGWSWSMPSLIVFRLVQGTGAGAIQPLCLTIIGDLYPGRQRAKIQGWISSVWGISSVLGPLAGGLITQHLRWAWVFWINLPLGLLASLLFILFLHERPARAVRSIDAAGAALFAVTVAALMVALTEIGTAHADVAGGGICVFVVAGAAFVWQERRARDPMIAADLWTRRAIATANLTTMLSGMTVIGLTTFLPMYVQGVLGRPALVAGFTLTLMVLGWPIGSIIAARRLHRVGVRPMLLLGGALLPLGALAYLAIGFAGSVLLAAAGSLVMGLGMGLLSISAILLVQNSVGWSERGAATASNIFSRSLGSTLGATLLGGVLNVSLNSRGGVDVERLRALLDHGDGGAMADDALRAALGHALQLTFAAMFTVAVLTFLAALLVPRVRMTTQELPGLAE